MILSRVDFDRVDFDSIPSVRLKTDKKFDKITQTWSVFEAEINNGRLYPQAVAYKNFIYVLGGQIKNQKQADSIEIIDITTGEVITTQTKLKYARYSFALVKVQNLAYIIGENITDHSVKSPREICTETVEILNLESKAKRIGSKLPFAGASLTANIF